ncbi:hypothetical protein BGY98DRAFT_961008 [Russula aff. rugulosa BPL654]|nr:hypothetical protein BGY98DRAFT_961008 [Russula aff. rugulosa BPL654]
MNGNPASVTLPTQVAPGDYLVHHKIIALHLAVTLGRAEPSSIHPARIYDPSVYSPGAAYTFLGGPVSNLASPAHMTG